MELLSYTRAKGDTFSEMVENFRKDPVYQKGDAWLIFANEGDLHMLPIYNAYLKAAKNEITRLRLAVEHVRTNDDIPNPLANEILHSMADEIILLRQRVAEYESKPTQTPTEEHDDMAMMNVMLRLLERIHGDVCEIRSRLDDKDNK